MYTKFVERLLNKQNAVCSCTKHEYVCCILKFYLEKQGTFKLENEKWEKFCSFRDFKGNVLRSFTLK